MQVDKHVFGYYNPFTGVRTNVLFWIRAYTVRTQGVKSTGECIMMVYAEKNYAQTVFAGERYSERRRSVGREKPVGNSRSGSAVRGGRALGKHKLKAFRRAWLLVLTLIISAVSLICLSGFTSTGTGADGGAGPERHKYYTAVYIDRDTTLWSIASEYMSEDYSSIKAYIREVREINGINGDTIYYGSNIIVPYYSGDLY